MKSWQLCKADEQNQRCATNTPSISTLTQRMTATWRFHTCKLMLCHTDSINNFKKTFSLRERERERERERWRTAHIQNLSLFYWLACCYIWMAQYWQVIQLTLAVTLKSWYRGKTYNHWTEIQRGGRKCGIPNIVTYWL